MNIFRDFGDAIAAITTNCSEFASAWDNDAESQETEAAGMGNGVAKSTPSRFFALRAKTDKQRQALRRFSRAIFEIPPRLLLC
jgi:hypothetical protein